MMVSNPESSASHVNDLDPDLNFFDQVLDYSSSNPCNYFSIEKFNDSLKAHKNNLKIVCFNVRSFNANIDQFLAIFENENYADIFIFCETWFTSTHKCDIDNFTSYHIVRPTGRGGGVSIYLKKHLNSYLNSQFSFCHEDLEVCTVSFKFDNTEHVIIGAYRPHGDLITFNELLGTILDSRIIQSKNCLLCGDLNINLCEQSTASLEFINQMHSFSFRPCITKPTRFPVIDTHTPSLLDQIWINSFNSFTVGIVSIDLTDHCPIFIFFASLTELNSDDKIEIKFRNFCNDNHLLFSNKISNFDFSLIEQEDPNIYFEKILEILLKFYNESFPIKTKFVSSKRLAKPWITTNIFNLIKLKSWYFKLLKLGLLSKEQNNSLKNKICREILLSKRKYYEKCFENCQSDLKKTWKLVKSALGCSLSNAQIKSILHENIEYFDDQIIADLFNSYFSNVAQTLDSSLPHTNLDPLEYLRSNVSNVSSSMYLSPVTDDECVAMIDNLTNLRTDLSSISIDVLKTHKYQLSPIISSTINFSFQVGVFPDILKIATITPIFKKGDSKLLKNYRPISVLPVLSKIFEKCLYNRLINFIDQNLILHPDQFGFRKNVSTESAVVELTNSLYSSLNLKKHSICVFIDFQKAFDTINHSVLLRKLEFYGVSGVVLDLFKSYLTNRKQVVKIGKSYSGSAVLRVGVPQGSILGPLLFIIYVNDIFYVPIFGRPILFADDTTLVFSDKSYSSLVSNCNSDLERFRMWCLSNRLSINIEKTHFILFTNRPLSCDLSISLHLNNQPIQSKTSCLFLGVFLDANLKFNLHIQHITEKISKSIGIMFKLSKIVPAKVMKTLYYSLVHSYLVYCNCVWGGTFSSHLSGLVVLHKRVIRLVSNSSFRAHTNNLFLSLGILKLQELHESRLTVYVYKNLGKFTTFDTNTRGSSNLRPEFQRLRLCQHSVNFSGPNCWNSLPADVKSIGSILRFKKSVKNHLLSRYRP